MQARSVSVSLLLPAGILALGSLAPLQEFEAGKVVTVRTQEVHYALRVPQRPAPDAGWPCVLFVHGSNMRGEDYVASLETAPLLEEWLLIGPTGPQQSGENRFNHGPGDERYVEEILDDVEGRLKIPIGRLYVGGHSQGAFLSHALARHMPDRVDGVIAVSGGSWATPGKRTKRGRGRSKEPIPIAIVHAQDDPVVPLAASVSVFDAYLQAGHDAIRLFVPPQGAHMFLRLPIVPAIEWLELMHATDLALLEAVLEKTGVDKDPRTHWDAAQRILQISSRHPAARSALEALELLARERSKDLARQLSRRKGPFGREEEQDCWAFLGGYSMLEAKGPWRKAFEEALEERAP